MRNVLLIAYSFPPSERSGARRPAALAKYLPRFGWTPIVLTPRTHQGPRNIEHVVETGYRDVLADLKAKLRLDGKRGIHEQFGLSISKTPGKDKAHSIALEVIRNLLAFPDVTKGWVPYAVGALEDLQARGTRIDAIISTFPPVSSHIVGKKAKQIFDCPWIADFRDLWTQDITTMRSRDLQFLQVPLEKSTLRSADALISVSDPWANRLRGRYSHQPVITIPNGFDPDDFGARPVVTSKFSITYAGVLYQGQRDPTLLFETLSELAKEGLIRLDDIQLRFYSPVEPWLAPLARRFDLDSIVTLGGLIPRKEVLQREMESQLLLLLSWTNPKDSGLHTGKLFEYLGARRPILAIGGNRGSMTEVLEETGAGKHVTSKAELRDFLLRAYTEYKRNGEVIYTGTDSAVSRYSHMQMTASFADSLDRVTSRIRPRDSVAAEFSLQS